MYTDKKDFKIPFTQKDRNFNNNLLAYAVVGKKCLIRMTGNVDTTDDARALLQKGEYFSSIEVYENGAVNLFVRKEHQTRISPLAVVRIRPWINDGWNAINGGLREQPMFDDILPFEAYKSDTPFKTGADGKRTLKTKQITGQQLS